jgi:glycosyltransferase involved in cell wall biosynthesis
MTTNPLVSAIIIFLNGERFIEEAIESVFAQTYAQWELLLVDDGSTDGSTAIARRYAEQSPTKVRYLEHENHQNRGMSASRNWGVKHAKGECIALLDADDVWFPQKLEQQVAILSSRPEAAMLYGRTQIWHSWTGTPEDSQRDQLLELGVQPNSLVQPPALFFLLLQGGNVQTPTTCNVLIRREAFERVGGFQETLRGMYEDQAFFVKLCLNAPVYVANECWARYRQHADSCCSIAERTGEADRAWLPFLNWIATYLTEQGMDHTRAWKALQQAMWPHRHPVLCRFQKRIRRLFGYGQLKLSRLAQRTLPSPAYHLLQRARQAVIRLATHKP